MAFERHLIVDTDHRLTYPTQRIIVEGEYLCAPFYVPHGYRLTISYTAQGGVSVEYGPVSNDSPVETTE